MTPWSLRTSGAVRGRLPTAPEGWPSARLTSLSAPLEMGRGWWLGAKDDGLLSADEAAQCGGGSSGRPNGPAPATRGAGSCNATRCGGGEGFLGANSGNWEGLRRGFHSCGALPGGFLAAASAGGTRAAAWLAGGGLTLPATPGLGGGARGGGAPTAEGGTAKRG